MSKYVSAFSSQGFRSMCRYISFSFSLSSLFRSFMFDLFFRIWLFVCVWVWIRIEFGNWNCSVNAHNVPHSCGAQRRWNNAFGQVYKFVMRVILQRISVKKGISVNSAALALILFLSFVCKCFLRVPRLISTWAQSWCIKYVCVQSSP